MNIDQIIHICKENSTSDAKRILERMFAEEEHAAMLASQLKTTRTPEVQAVMPQPTTVRFKPEGEHTSSLTGQKFIAYRLENMDVIARPHKNGKKLTDDEIAETVSEWNREAKQLNKDTFG